MRFFDHEINEGGSDVFHQLPIQFNKYTPKDILRFCIGAALYMPATRNTIAQEIISQKYPYMKTVVLDLEDALGDMQVQLGISQLVNTLNSLQDSITNNLLPIEQLPLLFVRVRNEEQLQLLINSLGDYQHLLTGYVLPKFSSANGVAYLQLIQDQYNKGYQLYAMPILESENVLYKEHRQHELIAIQSILAGFDDILLNVRIGSTDFCGLFGLRRTNQSTIYQIGPVNDCIMDILNVFLRENKYVVSGSVWEYFNESQAIKGLVEEIEMDKMHGLIGKTVIHPSHIQWVQAMYTVTHEEYMDAERILKRTDGSLGVEKSVYGNKMNEMKPHMRWATRIMQRAQVYGVLNPGYHYSQLVKEQVHS